MDHCGTCTVTLAEHICLCSAPFALLCSECVRAHLRKTKGSHSLEPIEYKELLRKTEDIPRYRTRLSAVNHAENALNANLTRIETCKIALNSVFTEWINEKCALLDQIHAKLAAEIENCKEKTQELMTILDPLIDSKLSSLILGPDGENEEKMMTELTVFQYKIEEMMEIRRVLEGVFQCEVDPSPLVQAVNAPAPLPLVLEKRSNREELEEIRKNKREIEEENEKMKAERDLQERKFAELLVENSKLREENTKITHENSQLIAKNRETQQENHKLQVKLKNLSAEQIKFQIEFSRLESERNQLKQELLECQKEEFMDSESPVFSENETHLHIECDGCQMCPITGPRWKCNTCLEFHFCQECYDTKEHEVMHVFRRTPEGVTRLEYNKEVHNGVFCDGCGQRPIQGPRWKCRGCADFNFCFDCLGRRPHPPHVFRRKSPSSGRRDI